MDSTTGPFRDDEFRRIAEALPLPALLVDRSGLVVYGNGAARALPASGGQNPAGRPFLHLLDESAQAAALAGLERALREQQPAQCAVRVAGAGAEAGQDTLFIAPREPGSDQSPGAVLLLVPGGLHSPAAPSRATDSRMAALAMMAGGVAHHFNNILGGAITAIDFALHSNDTARMQRALVTTSEALARASSLTQSMLVFAEGDRRATARADLAETVREFVEQWRPVFARKNLTLTLDAAPISPRSVVASSLRSVLGNIAANALDVLPPGGSLRLTLRAGDAATHILLSDNGPGIVRDDLERVFDPFFTTHRADDFNAVPHLGMGLATAWGIVRDMGGRIHVDSQLGLGTRFEIILPDGGAGDDH